MPAHLRRATLADAPAVAAVHVRSWQAAYTGVLPAAGLSTLSIPGRTEQWRTWLGTPGRTECWVAAERGVVVGFASLGPSRDAGAGPWAGEVYAIYLSPEAMGRGFGRALWATATDRLAATGHRRASVWVLGGNARARAFYGRAGLREDGATREEAIFGTQHTELRYSAALPTQPFAVGFATALDAGDRATAMRFLASDCHLAALGAEQVGSEATLTALLEATSGLQDRIDDASVQREIEPLGGERFRARVNVRLRHGGHAHAWRYQETLTIPPDLGVVRVVVHDPERPRLAAFLRRAGV